MMNSRTYVNLLLFILLVILFSLFIANRNNPVKITRLTSLKLDDINTVHIPRNNERANVNDNTNNYRADIVFEKTNRDTQPIWIMTQPYHIRAHQFRVNTLLGLSQTPVDKFFNADSLALQEYGLDNPRARIIFNQTEVLFGKTNHINNRRYLKTGNNITLINEQIYPLVSAQPSSFVDLHLLPDDDTITAIQIDELSITKTDDHWQVTPANKLTADQIQALLEHWRSAQAFAVHAYLPREKSRQISIQLPQQMIYFELSADSDWLILARPEMGIEYHLDLSFKNKLLGLSDA